MNVDKIRNYVHNRENGIIGEDEEYTKYSVVIPLVVINGKVNLLFEVRSKKMRSQPGEISFPGGKVEKGESNFDAAVRETCEELGIEKKNIEILGSTDMLITQHYKIIYTYAALIDGKTDFNFSVDEVDHLFFVPIDFFINTKPIIKKLRIITEPEEELPFEDTEVSEQYKWITGQGKVYFYKFENYVIWGITAKIVYNFVNMIGNDFIIYENNSKN